jgi:3'(2'), 5'-bisphosphate nucleotidase
MGKMETTLDRLKAIARAAGTAILEIYNHYVDIEIEQKSDDSPLTLADRISNEIICTGLSALDVQYPIISEENKEIPFSERENYEYCWMVDPLDGTKEFIKKNGEFTVNIALIHKGQPVLGIVYTPCTDEMYWAVKGQGAFVQKSGTVSTLKAGFFDVKSQALKVVASRSHLNEATKNFIEQLKNPIIVSRGSSLKFLMLACGEADLYPRMAPTMEWDTAAAQIILEEAGGHLLDAESLQALTYNKKTLLNPNFIACANGEPF